MASRLARASALGVIVVASCFGACAKGSTVFEGDDDDGAGGDGGAPGTTSSTKSSGPSGPSGPGATTTSTSTTSAQAASGSSVTTGTASSSSNTSASVAASSSSGGIVCGNFVCEAGEDSCTCSSDCSDVVNQCSACECGDQDSGGLCYCDVDCLGFGDCCSNYTAVCGSLSPLDSCDASECGGSGGNCYCDLGCVILGDCCADACAVCGAC